MTFDFHRALGNLPLALVVCFGIDAMHVALQSVAVAEVLAPAAVGASLAIAVITSALSGIKLIGRRP